MQKIKEKLTALTLIYLRIAAKIQLGKIRPLIIGVGGSSGKTSLVKLVSLALSSKFTLKQGGGKNSETGLPLDILNISIKSNTSLDWARIIFTVLLRLLFDWRRYDVYIAEMGIDSPFEPKNMSYLLKILKPKIAVLTNIAYEHSVYFDELVKDKSETARQAKILGLIAKEELLLLESVAEKGVTVVNLDDENIKSSVKDLRAKIVSVSVKDKNADFYLEKPDISIKESILNFAHQNKNYKFKIKMSLPDYYFNSILLAIAVSVSAGVSVEKVIESLGNNFSIPPGRMTIFEGIKNTTLIDSSYNNATLPPILGLLDFLNKNAGSKRKVAIIGDMRELGSLSKMCHEKVAEKILTTADLAVLIGPMVKKYAVPILEKAGFSYFSFNTFSESKQKILSLIKQNDLILVKGSQNTLFLERVVEMLLKNPRDKAKLCRRGYFWDIQRDKSL